MALFSIIVPVYNVEKYIEKCLDSIINQTFQDIEIILVDDGSPDKSPRICDDYAQRDLRIKVIHKKNGGLSDARNAGLEIACGEYVLFVDSDDYISYDTCEKFAPFAQKGYDILIGDALVEGGICPLDHISPTEKELSGLEYLKESLLARKAPMAAWLNVFKRDFLVRNGLAFKCGILHEDEQFTPRAFLCAKSIMVTGIEFYHYVLRENSITTKKDKRKNASDLYSTCCELEKTYNDIEDSVLRDLLLDSLSSKCLSLFQQGKLYQYGKEYIYKDFVKRNAKTKKTRYKANLYALSPRLYYFVNNVLKRIG